MKYALLVALLIAAPAAAAPDARLATAKTVFVEPLDTLEADRPVSACLAEHLPSALPLEVVADKAAADLVLKVKARISGETKRQLTGIYGTIQLTAVAQDGSKLWDDSRAETPDAGVQLPSEKDLACFLADASIELLRKGMRKARNGK